MLKNIGIRVSMDSSFEEWLPGELFSDYHLNYCDEQNGIFWGEVTDKERQFVANLSKRPAEDLVPDIDSNGNEDSIDKEMPSKDSSVISSIESINVSETVSPLVSSFGSSLQTTDSSILKTPTPMKRQTMTPKGLQTTSSTPKSLIPIAKTSSINRSGSHPLTPFVSHNKSSDGLKSHNKSSDGLKSHNTSIASNSGLFFNLYDLPEVDEDMETMEECPDLTVDKTSMSSQPLSTIFETSQNELTVDLSSGPASDLLVADELNSTFTIGDKTCLSVEGETNDTNNSVDSTCEELAIEAETNDTNNSMDSTCEELAINSFNQSINLFSNENQIQNIVGKPSQDKHILDQTIEMNFESRTLFDKTIEVSAQDLVSGFFCGKSPAKNEVPITRSLAPLDTTVMHPLRQSTPSTVRTRARSLMSGRNSSLNDSTLDFILNELKCNTSVDSDEFLTK